MLALKISDYSHVIKEPNLEVVKEYLDWTDPLDYTRDSLLQLGKKCGCTGGKWIVPLPSFNDAYEVMTTLEQMGGKEIELGEVQVRYDGLIGTDKGTLFVYTHDFEDRNLIFDIRDSIVSLCDPDRMFYKPDIFTVLGLRSGNDYDIKVSIYYYYND